eukprot:CAMPEP_0201552842 /NCGR_PEP_ID=MMETSP0173_2-20130828/18529_1 /ASSEMBLY_ACC=CAM_ASM_000268 /TAXON_ID=218659 /ORGANISM="Vexillifera sp., Strain DIVA3 564/2" /LENGTH=359 /DNA_ID=CAMNT_0047963401 /DNA_START=8 /DNA_END=1087 /DNA_ORIENTATION=+
MKMRTSLLIIASFFILISVVHCLSEQINKSFVTDEEFALLELLPGDSENDNKVPCMSQKLFDWRRKLLGTVAEYNVPGTECPGEGPCDDWEFRDNYSSAPITMDIIVNVICDNNGVCPDGVNQQVVNDQIKQLEIDYEGKGINFNLVDTYFRKNSNLTVISAYGLSSKWYNEINQVKTEYAVDPKHNVNVFITGQEKGFFGTLLGIGTFPWDPTATQATGGLWLNADYTGLGQKTLAHELGHNLGLRHTFAGSDEVSGCNDPCTENPHPYNDPPQANGVGDWCADTAATPTNYKCSNPSGVACDNVAWNFYGWGTSLYNIMSYTPDGCMEFITEQQSQRAKCWTCYATPGVLQDGDCPN